MCLSEYFFIQMLANNTDASKQIDMKTKHEKRKGLHTQENKIYSQTKIKNEGGKTAHRHERIFSI